mmetsp:Transcript_20098/g.58313  ORF Transcript_20098/g.58313 Transcript_20098/m.58313 type:complete len:589 (-) Transcript_20098:72-1838(-)
MQEVQVLARNQQIEHVVALPAHLKPDLDPIELCALEELRCREDVHQVALVQGLRRAMVQLVEHPHLQQLLVGHTHLDRVIRGAVLLVPLADERNVLRTAHVAAAHVEGSRRPIQGDAVRGAVGEERRVVKKRPDLAGQLEALDDLHVRHVLRSAGDRPVRRQRIHDGIVVEGGQIGIVGLDVHNRLAVVQAHRHLAGPRVVEEGERDAVLRAELLTHDDLVNVVELVPVLVLVVHVPVKRLELGAAGDGHVKGLRGVEGLLLEEVEVVPVHEIREQLVGQPVQHALLRKREPPLPVAGAVHLLGTCERLRVIEPIDDGLVFGLIQLHLDGLEGLHVENVVAIIERRLLVIEGREAHALEVASVTLLAAHHNPHGAPLRQEDRLHDTLGLGAESDRTAAVVNRPAIANLLPRHRGVLQELIHRMRQVLEGAQVDALVMAELACRHVAVILDDLADVLRRHLLLLLLHHPELPLLAIPLRVEGLPLPRLLIKQLLLGLGRLVVRVRVPRGRIRRGHPATGDALRRARVHLLLLLLLHSWHPGRQHEGVHSQAVLPHHTLLSLEVIHRECCCKRRTYAAPVCKRIRERRPA